MNDIRKALDRMTETQAELITVRLGWRDARKALRDKRAVRLFSGHYSLNREERDAHLRIVLRAYYDALHAAEEALVLARAEAERAKAEWQTLMVLEPDVRRVA